MLKTVSTFILLLGVVVSVAYGGDGKSRTTRIAQAHREPNRVYPTQGRILTPEMPASQTVLGTYTGLTTRYDYQANGGSCQMIRVNPANGNIHVIFHTSEDTLDITGGATRGTLYAFSTNGGVVWNNFSLLRIPQRRSGFPSLDLGRGGIAGAALIANHATVGSFLQSLVHVDFPEGGGVFNELGSPPLVGDGSTEPIWPHVAGAADGSIVFHASQNIQNPTPPGSNKLTRTVDYSSWPTWTDYPGSNDAGGGYVTVSTASGRVGSLLNANADGVFWLESTNNGASWPATPSTIYPPVRIAGPETLQAWSTSDVVYNGDTPLFAINSSVTDGAGSYSYAGARIDFWSAATGFVTAAPWDSAKYISEMVGQDFHLTMGWPSIGMSGSTIVIVYMAMQQETLATRNFADLWFVQSANNGVSWSSPIKLTNTPNLDERYPSVSKWNEPGKVNIVWQEDPTPGAWVRSQSANARARQVFLKFTLPSSDVHQEGILPEKFTLTQNYPNPFNPSTTIQYSIPIASDVRLAVYNMLGQKIATLVEGFRNAGTYKADFAGPNLASGVYYYTLKAGRFTETKKMLLLR